MSYQNSGLVACKDLQQTLQSVWAKDLTKVEPLPLLAALVEMSNPLEPVISPSGGKVRKLETTIFPRALESEATETSDRVCAATTKIDEYKFEYELDPNDILQAEFYFEAEDFTEWCGSNAAFLQGAIMQKVDLLRRKVATRVAEQVALMPGNYASDVSVNGDNALVVPTLQNTGGDPAVATLQKIDFATRMQTGFSGPMIVAGGADLYNYIQLVQSGCCYNGGIDIRDIYNRFGMAAIYDKRLSAELAGTGADSLVIDMNAIQIVNYIQAPWKDGMFNMEPRIIGGSGWAFAISDPTTGLLMDVRMSHDCGRVDVVIDTVVKAFNLPDNIFKATDDYHGVNYITKLKVTNPT
jgi:hypothetical protein